MESSCDKTNQSSIPGYSTPPRSNILPYSKPILQPKLLTSNELKRRFTSIKKHRYNIIRKTDGIVPLERHFNMPVILEKLFDYQEDFSSSSLSFRNENDSIVPSFSGTIIKEKLNILFEKK